MKSPNLRQVSRTSESFWRQVDFIVKTASPEYQLELIRCYHLKKFKPRAWEALAPVVQIAAQTLWSKNYLTTPEGEAYLDNCFSEPPYPRDPILDAPPAKKGKVSKSDATPAIHKNGFQQGQHDRLPEKETETAVCGDTTTRVIAFQLERQLDFIPEAQADLF